MLYLLNKDVRTVRWNGEPLHEATSAIVKETMNGDFTLTVKYPISDSGIYQLIQEDMLIKAPTPVLGAQLFRIKKPVEYNDHLEITAYHISDDVMQRSITPVSVTSQSCGMTLSRMVQNTKTALGDFSFNRISRTVGPSIRLKQKPYTLYCWTVSTALLVHGKASWFVITLR